MLPIPQGAGAISSNIKAYVGVSLDITRINCSFTAMAYYIMLTKHYITVQLQPLLPVMKE
jgi:hypothetical protein